MPTETLPEGDFGVEIDSDEARACLRWLVNQIGETKLRASVAKYQVRWPGSRPFVWTLLKWYRLKVPRRVYAPVRVPVFWLYVLCRRDRIEVKIGITGDWPSRISAFHASYRAVADVFDLDRSRAFLVGGSKAEALRRESAVKKQFASYCVDARSREWFDGVVADGVLAAAASFDNREHLVAQTLRAALETRATAGLESPRSPALTDAIAHDRHTLH